MVSSKKIIKWLKKNLKKKRYIHSLSVASMAKDLALSSGADPKKAYIAGLLHDIGKCIGIKKIKKLTIKDPRYSSYPNIKTLHGVAGSYMAIKKFNIKDKDIINAIADHVIPPKNTSLLSKIVFLADKLEPNRKKYHNINIKKVNELLIKDINKAFQSLYDQIIRKAT